MPKTSVRKPTNEVYIFVDQINKFEDRFKIINQEFVKRGYKVIATKNTFPNYEKLDNQVIVANSDNLIETLDYLRLLPPTVKLDAIVFFEDYDDKKDQVLKEELNKKGYDFKNLSNKYRLIKFINLNTAAGFSQHAKKVGTKMDNVKFCEELYELFCYLCNKKLADTRDHIPQQGFFLNPINKDNREFKGFTLPACSNCNNLFSGEEGYVRDLYATVGERFGNPAARNLMHKVTDSQADPQSIKIEYSGTGLDRHIVLKQKYIEPVMIKIAKGLYFQEYKQPVPPNYICEGLHSNINKILSEINPQILEPEILRYYDTFDPNILQVEGLSLPNDFAGFWSISVFKSSQSVIPQTYIVMILPPDFHDNPEKYGLPSN